jgi:ribonuclease R
VITGIESYGLFVQCITIPGEGLILRERLQHDYRYDRVHNRLVPRHTSAGFQVGDVVEVEVARVDHARREIDFDYLRHIHSITGPTRPRRGKTAKKRPAVKKAGKRRRTGRGRK